MFRYIFILLVLVSFCGGCSLSSPYMTLLKKDYDQAAFEYAAKIRADAASPRDHVLYGYALYKGGHYQEAYDALVPVLGDWRVGAYASFWAGLAALRMEDSAKLREAWSAWRMPYYLDMETLEVMNDSRTQLFAKRDLSGCAFLAEGIEIEMSEAFANDYWVRERDLFRNKPFSDAYPYDGLAKLPPKPYLP